MIGPIRLMLPKIALLIVGLAGAFAVYGQEDPYYDGKTVTLYVGRTPGSGADLHVRVFAEFWRRFIPGEPTIVVRNMPGGGGTRVWNFGTEVAAADGLHILYSPTSGAAAILKQPGLRANFSEMPFIGGLSSPNMAYVRTDKIKGAEDLLTIEGLKFAGQNPAHRFDLLGRLALDAVGADYQYVTAIPLWHNPISDSDGNLRPLTVAPDIPSYMEFYRNLTGAEPSGEEFEIYKWLLPRVNDIVYAAFLPPGTPEEYLNILRDSFVRVTEDATYQSEEEKMYGFHLPLINWVDGTEIIKSLYEVPEHVLAFLESYIAEGR